MYEIFQLNRVSRVYWENKKYAVATPFEWTRNTARMNVASPIDATLLRKQLMQNLFILNVAMIKSNRF